LKEGNNEIADYAAFVSAEIKPLKFLNIRPGVRFVKNSVYEAPPFLPSINTKVQLSPRHDLRVSYGRGFRAPSLRELYFYFYDSNHQVEGNPDLEAELSHNINGSWNWQIIKTPSLSYASVVGGFYNSVDNLIESVVRENSTVSTYRNIDKYKTKGITVNNTISTERLQFTAGFAYTGQYNRFNESDESLPTFTWSGEINTSVGYTFVKAGLTANLYYKYTGKTPFYRENFETTPATIYLAETDDYHWADVSLQKTFFKKLTSSMGIHNLFDMTTVQSTAAPGGTHSSSKNSLASGRSYYLTLTINL
jgi:outer membrane receptor for ferrienterochelin and colicins